MSDRKVTIDFSSPQFSMMLSDVGMEFGDKSDELITAQDIADLIKSEYEGDLGTFLSDFSLDAAEVFIQLDGTEKLSTRTHAKVEF